MRRKKAEILLQTSIVVLAVVLAILCTIDSKWFIAAVFMMIGIFNIAAVILRLKK